MSFFALLMREEDLRYGVSRRRLLSRRRAVGEAGRRQDHPVGGTLAVSPAVAEAIQGAPVEVAAVLLIKIFLVVVYSSLFSLQVAHWRGSGPSGAILV